MQKAIPPWNNSFGFDMVFRFAFCLLLLVPLVETNAEAQTLEVDAGTTLAERERLIDEMRKLVKRQVWAGVERKYKQLLSLEVALPSDAHLTGAYAARERGQLMEVYERLKLAAQNRPSKAVVDWLWDIDHNYGHVVLLADRKGTALLSCKEMPLDPNQRKAVEAAIADAEISGGFTGLLPRGEYTFSEQSFRVEPGIAVRIEVSPKMRRQGLIEPVIIYRELPTAKGTSE